MIYLIDSDISVLRALELFLESAGMECQSYQNSDSFLAKIKPSASDLVVLDLSMSRIIACEHLKRFSQNDIQIPVIIVAIFDDDQFRDCCRQYGVKGIMRKPVDSEALIDLIKYSLPV